MVKDIDHSLENFQIKIIHTKISYIHIHVCSICTFLNGLDKLQNCVVFLATMHHLVYVFFAGLHYEGEPTQIHVDMVGCIAVVVSKGNWSLIKNLAW